MMKKLIEESELRSLLLESEILRRLDSMGVDNWIWYGEALFRNPECKGTIEDWEEEDLPNIINKYKSFESDDCTRMA